MPLSDSQTPALATDDLVVELGGSAVLHGVTASVRPGEAVAEVKRRLDITHARPVVDGLND